MRTDLFDYSLPPERIAAHPLAERGASRLLELAATGVRHRRFAEWVSLLPRGALLVINDTRVLKARLLGRKQATGGRIELLLLRPLAHTPGRERWSALGRASKPLRAGTRIDVGDVAVSVVERLEDGTVVVEVPVSEGGIPSFLERHGHVPIPPYLGREDDAEDVERYQSVFARRAGSVAAPTASLHFDQRTLHELKARGIERAPITLHIGAGTFRPVTTEDLDEHPMHAEWIDVPEATAYAVARVRSSGSPVVAVGTTVVRALESATGEDGVVRAFRGETQLMIQPGYRFRAVDSLLTNFHMPQSTLLALVSAFAGRERVLAAYAEALREGYRFLSYGDAMWIPSCEEC